MQLARIPAAEEEVDVVVALVLGVFHDGIQLFELVSDPLVVLGEIATKFEEDFDGVLSAAICQEPPGRLRKEWHRGEDNEHGNDHKAKRESPSERRPVVADTEVDPVRLVLISSDVIITHVRGSDSPTRSRQNC